MAFVLTALTTAVSAVASAAGAAAGTAGTAAAVAAPMQLAGAVQAGGTLASIGSALTSSTAMSVLSGGLGLVSAMAAGRQAEAQAMALREQGEDARFDARSEEINSIARQTSLRRQLLKNIGEQDVAYAASGIDLSFGTPVTARADAIEDGNRAVMAEQDASAMRGGRLLQRAATYDVMADEAIAGGRLRMAGAMLQPLLAGARRGA